MSTPEITKEHEDLFKEIIRLRRLLNCPKENDHAWFSFDLETMNWHLKSLNTEAAGKLLLKKFTEEDK